MASTKKTTTKRKTTAATKKAPAKPRSKTTVRTTTKKAAATTKRTTTKAAAKPKAAAKKVATTPKPAATKQDSEFMQGKPSQQTAFWLIIMLAILAIGAIVMNISDSSHHSLDKTEKYQNEQTTTVPKNKDKKEGDKKQEAPTPTDKATEAKQ